ncbi:MAG: hypothetical protein ACE5JG_07205 [Planctomycetota bacterium]
MKPITCGIAVASCFIFLICISSLPGQKGKANCPPGKVEQYVFLCAEGPGKCAGTLAYNTICTEPSELGFQIATPNSKLQLEAATSSLEMIYKNLQESGRLESAEHEARGRRAAMLESEAQKLRADGHELPALTFENGAKQLRNFIPAGKVQPADAALAPIYDIPDGGCRFGDPCPKGYCGTILGAGTPAVSCDLACNNCKRFKPKQ